jgi:uncharacterized protein YqjF (DUF2071 family)
MLNYTCPPRLLEPLVPAGTVLDLWHDTAVVSLVAFMFRETRVRGVAVPCHKTFEEVNLRFYVRRELAGETRRAVVFIREFVPRRMIATIARRVYNEPYRAVSMSHSLSLDPRSGGTAEYGWGSGQGRCEVSARVSGEAVENASGSEAEFITEHYWGYTRQRDGSTLEYRVEHPPWRAWSPDETRASGNFDTYYGAEFGAVLAESPRSSFLAVGSEVTVYAGRQLPIRPGGV